MDEATKTSLTDQIDQLVQKQTFSLDAVAAINNLRATAKATQARLDDVLSDLKDLKRDIRDRDLEIIQLKRNLTVAEKQITDNAKLIEDGRVAITHARVAEAKTEALMFSMKTVFAPNIFREQVYKSVPMMQGNPPYPTTQSESGSVERKEGYETT